MRDSNEVPVVLTLLLLYCSSTTASTSRSAPHDVSDRCLRIVPAITYPAHFTVLMDSLNYEHLLGGDMSTWSRRDFDTNNRNDFFVQTEWKQSVGGVCRWHIQSCGYRIGQQDNWVFTQHIDKFCPATTYYTVTVCVKVTFRIFNCRERNRCVRNFEIFYSIANARQDNQTYTNTSNYILLKRFNIKHSRVVTIQVYFNLTPNNTGFYIAMRDPSSCITVQRVLVYRYECHKKKDGLVIFPRTAAPVDECVYVNAICVPNAAKITSLEVKCSKDGVWSGTPKCSCLPGFKMHVDKDGGQSCVACPAGTYRSASDPQGSCLQCPANTVTNRVAAVQCECLSGCFRNTEGLNNSCPDNQMFENPFFPCTQPPSVPPWCGAGPVTATTIHLCWSPPQYNGNRRDLYYTVQYSDPDNVGQSIMATDNVCIIQTCFTITYLQPFTTYLIIVTAHNGVSDQDKPGLQGRMVEIRVTTNSSLPCMPRNVQIIVCSVVIWEAPICPNGVIRYYEMIFWNSADDFKNITVIGIKVFHILLPDEKKYKVLQIRAVNVAGEGNFTNKVPVCLAPPVCPVPTPPSPSTPPIPLSPVNVTINHMWIIKWEKPVNQQGIKYYDVMFSKNTSNESKIIEVSENYHELTQDDRSYDSFEIRAVNGAGKSNFTDLVPVVKSPPIQFPESPTPQPVTPPGQVDVNDIHVLGCGIVGWKPPANTGGEMPGYAIRFFDGQSYETSQYQEIQLYFDDPNRRWAVATNLPKSINVYVDIRASNSNGRSVYSEKKVVADSTLCPVPEPCPTCPTAKPCPTCPTCPSCPTADPCPTCPTCPTCPGPKPCPTCPTCPTADPCPTFPTCLTCPGPKPCPTCPTCPTADPCPTFPTCPTCPGPKPCPTCPTCPTADPCPSCTPAPPCPTCPTCPTSKPCPTCATPSACNSCCEDCPMCPTTVMCEKCPLCPVMDCASCPLPLNGIPTDQVSITNGTSINITAENETTSTDETPTTLGTPATDRTTTADETPTTLGTPATDGTTTADETPTTHGTPAADGTTTTAVTPTAITTDEPPTVTIQRPGVVRNVRVVNCTTVEWDPPLDDGGEIMEYRIRVYSGASYSQTFFNERRVFSSTSTKIKLNWRPRIKPCYAMVKAKNRAGFSPSWTIPVSVPDCPTP